MSWSWCVKGLCSFKSLERSLLSLLNSKFSESKMSPRISKDIVSFIYFYFYWKIQYNQEISNPTKIKALMRSKKLLALALRRKLWAPLALNFSAVLRSRSRSVPKERRSILRSIMRSFSKDFLKFLCMTLYYFFTFWLSFQKYTFKAKTN